MSTQASSSGGISIGGAVFLIFLTVKLIAIEPVASWSWWWVTSPLWIGLCFGLGIVVGYLAIVAIVAGLAGIAAWFDDRRMRRMMREDS